VEPSDLFLVQLTRQVSLIRSGKIRGKITSFPELVEWILITNS
jgi:hypothetical protein